MADVTERRETEEGLRESEERFREAFEEAAVGMAHVDPQGRWARVNGKFCQIVGYEREELLGHAFWNIIPAEDWESSQDRFRRVLDGALEPYSVERRYIRKYGSLVWARLTVSLVRDPSGPPSYLIAVAEDITERKLEELVPDSLKSEEMDVLRLLAQGQRNGEIARKLGYSVGTINSRVGSILKKLGAENRREAVGRAVHIGLSRSPAGDRTTRKLW